MSPDALAFIWCGFLLACYGLVRARRWSIEGDDQ